MFEVWFLVNKFQGKLRGFFWARSITYLSCFSPTFSQLWCIYIMRRYYLHFHPSLLDIYIYTYICGVVVWTFNIFQLECKWYGAFLEYKITITLKGIKNAAALKKILHNRYIYIYYTPKINLILVTKVLSYKNKCKKKENSQDDDDIWPFENEIEVFPFFVCISLISH